MSNYDIVRTLILSTDHLDPGDRWWLYEYAAEFKFGWRYHTSSYIHNHIPKCVADSMILARSLNCEFVEWVQDGLTIEELPTYKW